jgi:hypothetical protein
MRKHLKKLKLLLMTLVIIVLGILTYELVWGKLLPYSPVKIGFTKYELSNFVIYIQDGAEHKGLRAIDGLFPSIEDFHQLKFLKKPVLYIFRDRENYLQRSISKARFCAYPNGSLLISPWALKEADEGIISLKIYVTHELSHTLLYQHMGFITAYFYFPRWLLEGIAVYSSNQMGTSWYPGKEETYKFIREGNFMPPDFYNSDKEDQVPINVKNRIAFIYSEFGCIVDYMVAIGGKDKFLDYMKTLLNNNDHNKVFKYIYGISFDKFLINFKEFIKIRKSISTPPANY